MITVRELITELRHVDPDLLIVMSADAEGNYHSPLASLWEGFYRPDSTWSGEVFEAGEFDGDGVPFSSGEDDIRCIVLNPTN